MAAPQCESCESISGKSIKIEVVFDFKIIVQNPPSVDKI